MVTAVTAPPPRSTATSPRITILARPCILQASQLCVRCFILPARMARRNPGGFSPAGLGRQGLQHLRHRLDGGEATVARAQAQDPPRHSAPALELPPQGPLPPPRPR